MSWASPCSISQERATASPEAWSTIDVPDVIDAVSRSSAVVASPAAMLWRTELIRSPRQL